MHVLLTNILGLVVHSQEVWQAALIVCFPLEAYKYEVLLLQARHLLTSRTVPRQCAVCRQVHVTWSAIKDALQAQRHALGSNSHSIAVITWLRAAVEVMS